MSVPPGVTLALVEAFEKANAGRSLVETLDAAALALAVGLPALWPTEIENERCGPCLSTVMLCPGTLMIVRPFGMTRVMSCA